MKKNVICIALLVTLALSAIVTLKSTKNVWKMTHLLIEKEVEALAYSNENPGGPNERHTQAVWCSSFWNGWKIASGCCYGWESCQEIHCGAHGSFSCDGNNWISY